MKARECPYCHESISKSRYFRYFLKGKTVPSSATHCHKEVKLQREPIPLIVWVCSSALLVTCLMDFFLYYMEFGFLKSLLCSLPIIALIILAMMAYSLCKMKFSKEEDT